MVEFFQLCINSVNLPFTALLLLVFAYWLLLLFGAVSFDTFDVDFDGDLSGGGDITDADPDFDADVGGGMWLGILKFFNVGDVPLMVLLSFVAFNLWAVSILTSYYLNPNFSGWVAVLWFVPNLLFSLFLAKFFTTPLKQLFVRMRAGINAPVKIVGQTCVVTTSEVTPKFGQAEIEQDGPPLTLNVRCNVGAKLLKGDEALVVGRDDDGTYVVVPFDLEMRKDV